MLRHAQHEREEFNDFNIQSVHPERVEGWNWIYSVQMIEENYRGEKTQILQLFVPAAKLALFVLFVLTRSTLAQVAGQNERRKRPLLVDVR